MGLYRNIAGINQYAGNLASNIIRAQEPDVWIPPPVFYDPALASIPDTSTDVYVTDTGATVADHGLQNWHTPAQVIADGVPTDYIPPSDTPKIALPEGFGDNVQPPAIPLDVASALKTNWLPLVTAAALLVVALKGDDLLGKRKKLVFIGGLGLLYYSMAKKLNTSTDG